MCYSWPPVCVYVCMSRENDCGQLARPLSDTRRTLSVGFGRQGEIHTSQLQRRETWAQRNSGEPVILYLRTERTGCTPTTTHKHSNKEDQIQGSTHRKSCTEHLCSRLTFTVNLNSSSRENVGTHSYMTRRFKKNKKIHWNWKSHGLFIEHIWQSLVMTETKSL